LRSWEVSHDLIHEGAQEVGRELEKGVAKDRAELFARDVLQDVKGAGESTI